MSGFALQSRGAVSAKGRRAERKTALCAPGAAGSGTAGTARTVLLCGCVGEFSSWANQSLSSLRFQVRSGEQLGTSVPHVLFLASALPRARYGRARRQRNWPIAPASANGQLNFGCRANAILPSMPSWRSSTKFAALAASEWTAAPPAACFPKGRTLKEWQSVKRREARANKGGCHGQRLSLLPLDDLGPSVTGVVDKRDDLPAHAGPRRGGCSASPIHQCTRPHQLAAMRRGTFLDDSRASVTRAPGQRATRRRSGRRPTGARHGTHQQIGSRLPCLLFSVRVTALASISPGQKHRGSPQRVNLDREGRVTASYAPPSPDPVRAAV